ncbi:MAG: 4Fe-4S binding protein [Nanoarchaeota archaeon]|nr:4Fe-4S binding protein [Nanoarchaeota archaeon]
MVIKIDYDKCCWKAGKCTQCSCKGVCKGCVEACPEGALKRDVKILIDAEKCTGCGLCVEACSHGAISLN